MGREEELTRAIRAKCLDCSGGARALVKRCAIRDCPLWPYRTAEAVERRTMLRGQLYLYEVNREEMKA